MKYNIFDVVELLDSSKAIITEVNKNYYKVKIIDKYNETKSKNIKEDDILKELFRK